MKTLTITITGNTDGDLENGLAEATKRFEAGNTSGFDSNDSGRFSFTVEGEDEDAASSFRKGDHVEALERRTDSDQGINVERGDRGRVDNVELDDDDLFIWVTYDSGAEIVYLDSEAEYALSRAEEA